MLKVFLLFPLCPSRVGQWKRFQQQVAATRQNAHRLRKLGEKRLSFANVGVESRPMIVGERQCSLNLAATKSKFLLAFLSVFAGAGLAAGQDNPTSDPFAFDGSRNITAEAHFGIVNGKLTAGIPYEDAFAVDGLWAPPYLSTRFKLDLTVMGQPVKTERYTWRPFQVDRAGSVQGIGVTSVTVLVPGHRAGLVEVTLSNPGTEPRIVPVAITVSGTLDRSAWWEFGAPKGQTPTRRVVAGGSLRLEQGDMAMALRASKGISWEDAQPAGRASVLLAPSGRTKLHVVFAIGASAETNAACEQIAAEPEKAMDSTRAAYAERVADMFQKLPRFESGNPAFERFYNRSLVHLVMNRWEVPEFVLQPYFSTGSVRGGCVCDYLWNFGENWEIFPLYDPMAARQHIKQFLATDMTQHFAFEPTTGKAFGPWYMVNQEKIIGMIYYYVKHTGDSAFLKEKVSGKTVVEHVLANALYGDDATKPVALIDYGASNSHLELRRGLPYNHIMPDLNGRRYENYLRAAELAALAGQPAPQLRARAEALKTVLNHTLWNKTIRWFDFQDDHGRKDTRYTLQMFKLFGSRVLGAEQEAGLLDHLNNEQEFLSEFGLHSLSKTDPAYDPADIDNGGPGACTSFPPQIAERLFKAGHPEAAGNILKRILWWGDRMPYWGDSIVADRIDYRKDTPLQCTIDGAAVAQSVIFGMFGVQAEWNGDLRIEPHPPAFAPKIALRGLRLRRHVLDVVVEGGQYEVREGVHRIRSRVGQSILVRGDRFISNQNPH